MAGDITQLLEAWRRGDPEAQERLFPLVYSELRRLARRQLRRAGPDASLDTTELVHESYLRLVGGAGRGVHGRQHFFALAATAMRQVLIDFARRRAAGKRGSGRRLESLPPVERVASLASDRAIELLAVDEALSQLQAAEPRLARVVELRVFGGLSVEETAMVLGLSEGTIKRDWSKARLMLAIALRRSGSS